MNSAEAKVLEAKRQWLELLLRERFAPELSLDATEDGWVLCLPGADGVVRVFAHASDFRASDTACAKWNAAGEGFNAPLNLALPAPGCAVLRQPLVDQNEKGWGLHYDVLGLTFWMLTRQEEIGRTDLDKRGRFPATASHAFKHGYLERPIVDEWLDILGQIMVRQWPGVGLTQHRFTTRVSHDVDNPSRYAFGGLVPLARVLAVDVIRRRDVRASLKGIALRARSRNALQPDDPANTFDWIMDQSDQRGLTSAFYFICGRTDRALDAQYEPEDARIRALMRNIHERGHEIGLHPSYKTYRDPPALAGEYRRLRRVCSAEGIEQPEWGGRMHFLRWDAAVTLRAWDDAGLDYDSTLSYADSPGFRCGTCFEYPAFDPVGNEALRLRIRPLVAMECTVIARRYLGLGDGEQAFAKFAALKNACRAVRGCFTLLWHNSHLESARHKALYSRVLDA